MNKTNTVKINENRLCVTRTELAEMLGCGLATADIVAKNSGARIQIGKRVLISVEKVRSYIDEECNKNECNANDY
ncbi:hypothetical protein [[Clostridium] polysaccharolyticum]|uniref:DNA binding domain-containing protein, excisionase family n=1 Tax=[Clostridium] polysaccharolyticum TaxID=29364 RepID=A0A1H9Y9U2_9FIRM|nr:hypothetical protein [[Clostridium] polysaccharolyticum]SES65699.1 hypothetical protein SAMN04487772_101242 [[Clostridium] polysaccharolyticum]